MHALATYQPIEGPMEILEVHYKAAGICTRPHLLLTAIRTYLSTVRRACVSQKAGSLALQG